jgi:hypothetical protein
VIAHDKYTNLNLIQIISDPNAFKTLKINVFNFAMVGNHHNKNKSHVIASKIITFSNKIPEIWFSRSFSCWAHIH